MSYDSQNERSLTLREVPSEAGSVAPAARPVTRGRRLSFREAMTLAERQVGYPDGLKLSELSDARDICKVMAEVYMMGTHVLVRVDDEEREAGMVAEVFAEITRYEFDTVLEKLLQGCLVGVRNPRSYIRTMLYNEVFGGGLRMGTAVRG